MSTRAEGKDVDNRTTVRQELRRSWTRQIRPSRRGLLQASRAPPRAGLRSGSSQGQARRPSPRRRPRERRRIDAVDWLRGLAVAPDDPDPPLRRLVQQGGEGDGGLRLDPLHRRDPLAPLPVAGRGVDGDPLREPARRQGRSGDDGPHGGQARPRGARAGLPVSAAGVRARRLLGLARPLPRRHPELHRRVDGGGRVHHRALARAAGDPSDRCWRRRPSSRWGRSSARCTSRRTCRGR